MGLENSLPDPVMNDIIGCPPCNFCDYSCIIFKFVAHHPALVHFLLQTSDASLAGIILVSDGLTFEGYDASMISGDKMGVRLSVSLAPDAPLPANGRSAPSDQGPPSSQ